MVAHRSPHSIPLVFQLYPGPTWTCVHLNLNVLSILHCYYVEGMLVCLFLEVKISLAVVCTVLLDSCWMPACFCYLAFLSVGKLSCLEVLLGGLIVRFVPPTIG